MNANKHEWKAACWKVISPRTKKGSVAHEVTKFAKESQDYPSLWQRMPFGFCLPFTSAVLSSEAGGKSLWPQ